VAIWSRTDLTSIVPASVQRGGRIRGVGSSAITHEVLMGAQDNLTNVLAVMLGVTIGSGRAELVALAGASAAVAEAVSMGGVLYSATRAGERSSAQGATAADAPPDRLRPAASGFVTFVAALVAGMLPLLPFTVLPLSTAVAVSVSVSLVALFVLGSWAGRIGGAVWWRDGVRLLVVGSVAALAAVTVGAVLRVA
jgi:VIT1/CCC1 family predicted Fe2+/Mn2+ transporter